jgi:serine/threonine kinase 38
MRVKGVEGRKRQLRWEHPRADRFFLTLRAPARLPGAKTGMVVRDLIHSQDHSSLSLFVPLSAAAASASTSTATATATAPPPSTSSRRAAGRRPSPSDYTSLALIGRGAFGEVRLARERSTGALVAVKALDKAEMRARGQVGHVRSERDALAAAALRACPFIVKLRSTFQDEARLFLVMDYCPGGDLLTLLQRVDTLPPDALRFYAAQLVAAVAAIHGSGYVHRDIKPDNLLLDARGHVKLSDFGLCTAVEWAGSAAAAAGAAGMEEGGGGGGATTTTTTTATPTTHRRAAAFSTVGTPDYIAPEVLLRSPGGYGPAADWWSVGAVLFEALVGHPPFAAPTPAETVRRAVAWREHLVLPDPGAVGADAVDLLARLLCDVSDRLGAGPGGAAEVRAHPFFAGVDWEGLSHAAPPHVPALAGPADVSHFDDFSAVDDGGVGLGMHVAGPEEVGEAAAGGGGGGGGGGGEGGAGGPAGAAGPNAAPWPYPAGSRPGSSGGGGRGRLWKRADPDFAGYTFRGTVS